MLIPTRLRIPAVAAVICLLAASVTWAGTEEVKDGVLHVTNGNEPSGGSEVVQFEEMWRVGGEDSEDFFGLVSQVLVGDDGNIYLLDTRLSEVPVYSPDGERINTLSREGEGPGETRLPSNLAFLPDGNLGLLQIFPGKITKIDSEGDPQGVLELSDATEGGFLRCMDMICQGEHLIISGEEIEQMPPTGQRRTTFVASFDMTGEELVRFVEYPREVDYTKFEWLEDERLEVDFRKVIAGRDGRVYVAPYRSQYRIDVYGPDGKLDRVITRDYEHQPRTEEEFDRVKTALETGTAQLPNPKIEISPNEPDIGAMRLGLDGNLWVESSRGGRGQDEGIMFTWDVFDPDGHFIKQVSAACEGDGVDDMLLWTEGGAVLVTGFMDALIALQGGAGASAVDEEEAEPMEIICLRKVGS